MFIVPVNTHIQTWRRVILCAFLASQQQQQKNTTRRFHFEAFIQKAIYASLRKVYKVIKEYNFRVSKDWLLIDLLNWCELFSLFFLLTFVGIYTTFSLLNSAFSCHMALLPLYKELRNKSYHRMCVVFIAGVGAAALLYEVNLFF